MLRGLVKDSIVYGGSDVTVKMLAFMAFPLIAAALSPDLFGLLELVTTAMTMIGIFVGCGLNNALQRFYWDQDTKPDEKPVLVSTGLAMQALFGSILFLLGVLVVPILVARNALWGYEISWVGFAAALILAVVTQWSQYLLDVTRLHFAPWKYFFLTVSARVMGLGLAVVAVVIWGWGVDGYLSVQAAAVLAILPFAGWVVRRDLTPRISTQWGRIFFKYGHPFIFVAIAYWLFGSIDRWMLAAITTLDDVGLYSVAFRFASIALLVSTAFGLAWSPHAIKVKTDFPGQYREFYVLVLLVLLAVMLLIGGSLALFSGEILMLIMPLEYLGSAAPLSILVIGVVLQSTQQVTAVGISLEKKTFLFARLTWITAGVNAGLNYLLIPKYGVSGAAWATMLSYLVLTSSYLYFTQKLHPLPIRWGVLAGMLAYGALVLYLSLVLSATDWESDIIVLKSIVLVAGATAAFTTIKLGNYELNK